MATTDSSPSFFARLRLAFRVLGSASLAAKVAAAEAPSPAEPPERKHASGLALLALLQREGRWVDFLQEDISSFSDAEVGGAARVVHAGGRRILQQYLALEPVMTQSEGDTLTVPVGFDAQRIRLTGNVAGQPPYKGTLKHHGWAVSSVRLPDVAPALDPRIIAPAEVEL